MKKYFLFWCCLVFGFSGVCQWRPLTANEELRLIFKLKPAFRNAVANEDENLAFLLDKQDVASLKRLFPNHPKLELNPKATWQKWVDLSLLYELKAKNSAALLSIQRQLVNSQVVEYAEIPQADLPQFNPSDPGSDSLTGTQKGILRVIKAYQGWNISKGDSSVMIGILETGVKWRHEDLIGNVAFNRADPINGLDDDGNGYVDDFQGWDLAANDNDPTPDVEDTRGGHGTSVASLASSTPNNGKGVSGIGMNCRFLPIKIWNYSNNTFSSFRGYEAIVYAADRGCKVINCSWGSRRLQLNYELDILTYAIFNKNAVVVAAGGNTFAQGNFVPATSPNVIGVAFSDSLDLISNASTYSYGLDITAPGVGIYGLTANGNYGITDGGSSMAAPLVSGAAALVRAKFPALNAIQVGELLRINTDKIDSIPPNLGYVGQVGRGRLNIEKALKRSINISIKAMNERYQNRWGTQIRAGDTIRFFADFLNVLSPVSSFSVKLLPVSSQVLPLVDQMNFDGLQTMQSLVNPNPFTFKIADNAPNLQTLVFKLRIEAQGFKDEQYFTFLPATEILAIDPNQTSTVVTANGRLGYQDQNNLVGNGIRYKNSNYNGEAGLMIGAAANAVSNCVFGASFTKDNHFLPKKLPAFQTFPGLTEHALSYFNDSLKSNPLGLYIKQSTFGMAADSLAKVVFINYEIQNRSANTFDSLVVGQYNDWEVEDYRFNKGAYDTANGFGFTWSTTPRRRFAATVSLTPNPANFFIIDGLPNNDNGNINLFDGFQENEKWTALNQNRYVGGASSPKGNNVVQVVGSKLFNFPSGKKRKAAFAYVFADSLPELVKNVASARRFYKQLNTGFIPATATESLYCKGDTFEASIKINVPNQPTPRIRVYKDSLRQNLVFEGNELTFLASKDTTLWISNVDSVFESAVWKRSFKGMNLPQIQAPVFVPDSLNFLLSDTASLQIPPDAQNSVLLERNGQPSQPGKQTFSQPGIYKYCILKISPAGCRDSACFTYKVYLQVNSQLNEKAQEEKFFPNPAQSELRFYSTGNWVKIFAPNGKLESAHHLEMGWNKLDISKLKPGVYFLRSASGKSFKLIKESY